MPLFYVVLFLCRKNLELNNCRCTVARSTRSFFQRKEKLPNFGKVRLFCVFLNTVYIYQARKCEGLFLEIDQPCHTWQRVSHFVTCKLLYSIVFCNFAIFNFRKSFWRHSEDKILKRKKIFILHITVLYVHIRLH